MAVDTTMASKSSKALAMRGSYRPVVRLIDIMLTIMAIELIAGGIIVAREMIETRKIKQQIAQIDEFNSATSKFYDKYNGLPGDLLSAQAERMGFPAGDGTPAHSDGDGKLQPCSPQWHEGLGCETLLFWSQLKAAEMMDTSEAFTAAVQFTDTRITDTGYLDFYLPKSRLSKELFITVWSASNPTSLTKRHLPEGNYYELTQLHGVEDSKMINDPYAISPIMTKEIDKKLDDGHPFTGKIMVNAKTGPDEEGWSSFPQTGILECVTDNQNYNITDYFKAHRALCHIAIAMDCCETDR